ncbi:MAG: Uma2 family endonuclease [Bradymonadaceae bacterium]
MALAPDSRVDREQDLTVDDYMALDDDRRFELIRGNLMMVPSPSLHHQRTVTELGGYIRSHVRDRTLGECLHAPLDLVLADDTVLQPDFLYVADGRLDELYDGHGLTGAPDLVIEVLSPSTEQRDRHEKRQLYAETGVPWLLLVEPKARVVEVLRLGEDEKYIVDTTAAEDDTLEFGLFPELELDLSEVWFDAPDSEGASEG